MPVSTDPGRDDHSLGAPRLIACGPDRTLIARREGDGATLVKLYERGSIADAERELALGRAAAGPGVVRHLGAGRDEASGRPALYLELVPGSDLGTWLCDHGAMAEARAAAIALALATTLRHVHGCGLLHLDVKPHNLVWDERDDRLVLIDFEHAATAGAPAAQPAPGEPVAGTHGFAPPEAYDGAAPCAAFDVFGLGCTLHALLTGTPPFRSKRGAQLRAALAGGRFDRVVLDTCAAPLRSLVEDCLASADRRPALAEVIERLTSFDATAGTATGARDRVLAAEAAAADADTGGEHAAALRRLAGLQSRWRRRWPAGGGPFEPAAEGDAGAYVVAAARLARYACRAPRSPVVLAARERLLRLAALHLDGAPAAITAAMRDGDFDAAIAFIDGCAATVDRAEELGRLPLLAVGVQPTALQRDPRRFLAAHRAQADRARSEHRARIARLESAEAELDLDAATALIDEVAASYGGASGVVAELRDRCHRLEFYLARIAQMAPLAEELGGQLAAADGAADRERELAPLTAFLAACRPLAGRAARAASTATMQTLRRSLADLLDAFPHLQRARPAHAALERAMTTLTERAWDWLGAAREKLETPPLPIRPLQELVHRLDGLRLLDLLVDLPARPRTRLLDELESVRAELERARATRDRIARGAQEAMERGHLTTALFDVQRAADQFADDDPDHAAGGPGLASQYREVQRRKREIDATLARNHELAARCVELRAGGAARRGEHIAALQERERLLAFLCEQLGPDRGVHFAADLRSVQFDEACEHAARGEDELAAAGDPEGRLLAVERTLSALHGSPPALDWPHEQATALAQVVERWEQRAAELRAATGRSRPGAARRGGWLAGLAAATVLALGWFLWPAFAGRDHAGIAAAIQRIESAEDEAARRAAIAACAARIGARHPGDIAAAAASLANAGDGERDAAAGAFRRAITALGADERALLAEFAAAVERR